jgi:hypothetical protein
MEFFFLKLPLVLASIVILVSESHGIHNPTLLFDGSGSTQTTQGQGQGYIATNNQSVSMSWYRAQSRTIDQSLLSP